LGNHGLTLMTVTTVFRVLNFIYSESFLHFVPRYEKFLLWNLVFDKLDFVGLNNSVSILYFVTIILHF